MDENESLIIKRAFATTEAMKSPRVRWVIAKGQSKVEIDEKRYLKVVDSIVRDETDRYMIIGAIKDNGPLTVEELSRMTGLQPNGILHHIIALRMKGVVGESGEKDRQYIYKLL